MKKLILAVLIAVSASVVLAETDYPSATALSRILVRLDRIAAQLTALEASVALIPTAS